MSNKRRKLESDIQLLNKLQAQPSEDVALVSRIMDSLGHASDSEEIDDDNQSQKDNENVDLSLDLNAPPSIKKEPLHEDDELERLIHQLNKGGQCIDAHIKILDIIEANTKRKSIDLSVPNSKRHSHESKTDEDTIAERYKRIHGDKTRRHDPG